MCAKANSSAFGVAPWSSLRNGKVHKVKAQSDVKLLHCKSDCKGNPINSNMCTVKQILEIDHLQLFNLIADKQMDLAALGLLTSEQQALLIHSKTCTYHELAFAGRAPCVIIPQKWESAQRCRGTQSDAKLLH
jgi:hypothetical protein